MKIAIIGAGWFGCHLGLVLKNRGYNITIFELENRIFSGASLLNQNRVHAGFHYPRSYKTRNLCIETFVRFIHKYGDFLDEVENNLYCIARENSKIDFKTYLQILDISGLKYEHYDHSVFNIRNIEGCIKTKEMKFKAYECKKFFESSLKDDIKLNRTVKKLINTDKGVLVDGEEFDLAINCTYNYFNPIRNLKVYYIPSLCLLYKKTQTGKKEDFALTILDGNFASLFPFYLEDATVVYTLTHVEHTHLKKCTTIQQALQIKDGFNQEYLEKLRKKFERDFMHFYPDFLKEYEYLDFFIAIKTWLKKVEDANRECIVNFDENIINTFSGKINGIFYAEDKIGEFLKGREE
jgi:hypothetical protein